jgi:hypothetical protein
MSSSLGDKARNQFMPVEDDELEALRLESTLIGELKSLRNYVLNEGQRIEREVTEYVRLNQGAIESTKVITETLLKWKTPARGPRMQ